jgi:hypothetical protein
MQNFLMLVGLVCLLHIGVEHFSDSFPVVVIERICLMRSADDNAALLVSISGFDASYNALYFSVITGFEQASAFLLPYLNGMGSSFIAMIMNALKCLYALCIYSVATALPMVKHTVFALVDIYASLPVVTLPVIDFSAVLFFTLGFMSVITIYICSSRLAKAARATKVRGPLSPAGVSYCGWRRFMDDATYGVMRRSC